METIVAEAPVANDEWKKQTVRERLEKEAKEYEARAEKSWQALASLPGEFLDLTIGELHAAGVYI